MLLLLNQTYEDSLPVQADIRAGMKSEATQDKLEMSYEYTGNKQVGYAAMLGVNTGLTKTNKITISDEYLTRLDIVYYTYHPTKSGKQGNYYGH